MNSSNIKKAKKDDFKNRKRAVYICPTDTWGTRERTVLKDALIAMSNGLEPHIYCLKDSFLDLVAKEKNLEVIHHYGKVYTRFFKWYKLIGLGKIVRDDDIAFVHCYHLNFLWPISFFLKSKPEIPLFFTTHREIKKNYTEIYHRPLISRVDHVFVSTSGLISNLITHLEIPLRKIKVMGFGNEEGSASKTEVSKVRKDIFFDKETWIVGTYLSSHHKNKSVIQPLIYAIMGYNQKHLDEKKVRLVLISDRKWNQILIYQDLIRFIKDLGCENDIIFYSGANLLAFQTSLDLWISGETSENLEDLAVNALLQSTPVLVPRTSVSKELLRDLGSVGLTYKAADARDLRDQMTTLLSKRKKFTRQISKVLENMSEQYHMSTYKHSLFTIYNNVFTARRRVSEKRSSKQLVKGP